MVIALKASPTARIRAIRDLLAGQPVEIAGAIPALVVVPNAGPDDVDVGQVADDQVAERDVLLDDPVLLLGQARRLAQDPSGIPILPTSWSRPATRMVATVSGSSPSRSARKTP